MQQLQGELKNTPRNASQVPCSVSFSLTRVEKLSDQNEVLTCNNPDAAITLTNGGSKNSMLVYVVNKNGNPLMPCKPAKARKLLKDGKARVLKRTPFTIQLLWDCEENVQDVTIGVDSGYKFIGLSAITEKKEVYSAEVILRTDIVKLLSERRMYRRARRSRHHWYRKSRFLNRKKPEGWLAPSIQNKLDTHIKVINFVKSILPVSKINIEVAAFDIQKIKNPDIKGIDYQNGEQKDFWNVREYVLYRDNHTCQYCKGKDKILNIHHLKSRQIGGDRPDNLITLCSDCHSDYHKGKFELKVKQSKGFKAETFMGMVGWRLVNELKELGNIVTHTYGYITKSKRIELGLNKSHINDAFVIANGNNQIRHSFQYIIRQIRKCNRKLFKGIRSHIKNTAPREVFKFRLWDKVLYDGNEMFIKGRRITGKFALSDIFGNLLKEVSYKKLKFIEKSKTFLQMAEATSPLA